MPAILFLGVVIIAQQRTAISEGRVQRVAQTVERRIELAAQGRDTIDFRIGVPGSLRVQVAWTGSADNLAIILNGPGQVGYYRRVDGPSPATLDFVFNRAHAAANGQWRISIVNFGAGIARGWALLEPPGRRGFEVVTEQPVAPPDSVPPKRLLAGGIVETFYPDGRRKHQRLNECNYTVILPDGTHQTVMCMEAIRVELATLPEGLIGDTRFGQWLDDLAPNLLEAIRKIVNDEASINNLVAFENDRNMSKPQRIDIRLRALNRLL